MIKSPSSLVSGSSCANFLPIPCLFSAKLSKTGRAVRLFETARLRHALGRAAAVPAPRVTSHRADSHVQTAATNSLPASQNASGSRNSTAKQGLETIEQLQRRALLPAHNHKSCSLYQRSQTPCTLCRSVKPDKKSNKSKPANFAKKFKTSSRAIIVQQVSLTIPQHKAMPICA